MNSLDIPLTLRLSKAVARKLEDAGITTIRNLIENVPRRYYHWGALTAMSNLRQGEDVTLLAKVVSTRMLTNRSRRGVRFEVLLTDDKTRMTATFFAKADYKLSVHQRLLIPGATLLFAGKVGNYRGEIQLIHPQFEEMEETNKEELQRLRERPIPIYSAVGGMTSWALRRAIALILDGVSDDDIEDAVPVNVRERYDLLPRAQAIRLLHAPRSDKDVTRARVTMAWSEALVLQTGLLLKRRGTQAEKAPSCQVCDNSVYGTFMNAIPFPLTESQKNAISEISADLARTIPMQRLLQGDVGAGKTIVALAAMCQVVGAGHQAAFLAPTSILAEQHVQSMSQILAPVNAGEQKVPVALLTGASNAAQRKSIQEQISARVPMIIIGTHALIQDSVFFADLGLVVIDEQHRFGVAQRDKLRQRQGTVQTKTGDISPMPHQLVMTATPIPRTVAMTVFGDLDETRMEGLPAGRKPVETFLVDHSNTQWMNRLWERASEEIANGGRVYVVCPHIDEDEDEDLRDNEDTAASTTHTDVNTDSTTNVTFTSGSSSRGKQYSRIPLTSVSATVQTLRAMPVFKDISIAQIHGRMPEAEKSHIMDEFASGKSPLLVATTVIEVGVDIPEATMMVVIDAQQFGLSQLHQLRGRVGRSARPSLCMAVHRHGISAYSMERLEAFAATTDGFTLANEDLRLRREGDVLGAEQSGPSSGLRFLSVLRDEKIIAAARTEAEKIVSSDPTLRHHDSLALLIRDRALTDLVWMNRS